MINNGKIKLIYIEKNSKKNLSKIDEDLEKNIESYIGTFFSKEYVLKRVLNMNDADIAEMRDQITKELNSDPLEGGIDMPDGGDGITRYPQDGSGNFISADDLEGSDGVNNKGDENGGN